jgi:two-component system OmpR family response regulator
MPFSPHPAPPGSPAEPAGRGRVLIVEDDPEAALFATLVLRQRGRFDVTHTADPAVALVLAASGPWDLVLTDMDLPVMSGMDLLAALRELVPRVPVLLVTASPARAFPVAPGSAGRPGAPVGGRPDGLLVKPFRAEQLLSAAITLAGGRSA